MYALFAWWGYPLKGEWHGGVNLALPTLVNGASFSFRPIAYEPHPEI
jgi:hypothetical protein